MMQTGKDDDDEVIRKTFVSESEKELLKEALEALYQLDRYTQCNNYRVHSIINCITGCWIPY